MTWYALSYDLRTEKSATDYQRLYDFLSRAVDYCWPLESFWIINTPLKPSEVITILKKQTILDDNDGIIVLEITGFGNFDCVKNANTAQWLRDHIRRV